MECKQAEILERCPCTNESCERRGICCECLAKHLKDRTFPACVFPTDTSLYKDRSFESFAQLVTTGHV